MTIRRLDPQKDRERLAEIYDWDREYPRWFQDLEKVSRWPLEQFLAEAPARADLGVFDDEELVALYSIIRRAPYVFEGHIWAKRGSRVDVLANSTGWVIERLVKDLGMQFGYVWIAKKNLPIKQMCIMAGLGFDGATQIDGESHGKPIVWERYSTHGQEKAGNQTTVHAVV